MDSRTDTEDAVIEQVPHYSLTTLDDGSCEKLRLIVELPGVESSAGLHVEIEGNRAFVHFPGRYRLDLPLGVTVADTASVLKFVKNRQYLKAEYEVVARSSAAASAMPPRSRKPARTPSPPPLHPDPSDASSPRTATNGLHDSFMADAVKLRDAWRSTAQGAKSHGAGPSKQASSKRASARPHTASSGEAPDQEEPNLNGHRSGQANGWQRGFLNQAAANHNKAGTASSSAHEQEFDPDGSRAGSSGASSSEQWEPHDSQNGHFAGKDGLHATPSLERRGDSASSNLYETAKVLSNREAAAECASKAQEALAEADFDKAERLFQKAERLVPGQYAEKAQTVERRRKAHEAQMAAKKREEREAAKKKKREEDRRKREEQQKLEEQQRLEEEQRRKAEAARAAAEEETARRQEQERASARQREQDSAFPDFGHKRFWGYLSFAGVYSNIIISFLFIGMCSVLYFLGGKGIVNRLQVGRHGSMQQRTCIGLAAVAFWALAIFALVRYSIFCMSCVLSLICLVFWQPPISAAVVEFCLLGLLCFLTPGLTALICLPLMWHFVGGGFSAIHGTVASFLYVVYVDEWMVRALPVLRPFSFILKLAGPLLYAKLALLCRGWLEFLLFMLVDWWAYSFIRSTSSEREKADDGAGLPMGSESCKPEPVPNGAAPEVARVLQASSWYAVLEVASNATVEEVRKAHKVKSLVTHPDKLGAQKSGAHEASVRVNTARDVLADAQKRAAYDAELRAAAAACASPPPSPSGSSGVSPGFFTEFTGRRAPCTRTADHTSDCVCMPCKACSQWHHVYVTSRPRTAAYFCTSCHRHHTGVNRTVWKEKVSAGFFSPSSTRVYLYAMGFTLDITDITDSCKFWSWISSSAKGPSCHNMLQFRNELPIREECFTAYKVNQEAAASNELRRSAKRSRGGRRRR